ncbi:MAG: MBL fold metallo-hydrolase [Armatimonadota bacterium]|nr:MBL fold metallo-hydrolase [Armatimonadota bacterium]
MKVRRLVVGQLQTNCYIVADDNGDAVIIDPGSDAERIEDVIVSHELTPKYILCTHGHPDHTFAAGRLQAAFNIDTLIHDGDRPLIEQGIGELAFIFDMRSYMEPSLGPSLTDGQIIQIGSLQLRTIHTPGHTPGGVSFLCGKDVFTGDTLFAGGVGRTDLPGGSERTLLKSIETRLMILDDDIRARPGHSQETTIGDERQSNPWLRKI